MVPEHYIPIVDLCAAHFRRQLPEPKRIH